MHLLVSALEAHHHDQPLHKHCGHNKSPSDLKPRKERSFNVSCVKQTASTRLLTLGVVTVNSSYYSHLHMRLFVCAGIHPDL